MAKILITDNQHQYLSSVTTNLRCAGIEVAEASCIFSALESCREWRPDIVVCAEHFAGLDVVDLLEIKQSDSALAEIGTVVVSPSNTRKLECFRLGCDDFISVPTDDAELFFRICALLRRIGSKGVRGNFSDISIFDLIQMLVASRRSGKLALDFNGSNGSMYFHEGHVFHAEMGNAVGEEGFLKLLRAANIGGSFNFSVDEANTEKMLNLEKTIEKRTDHLLLGLASVLDEAS